MKKLVPAFLKKLDQHLLLNHPLLWISKIHYVIFYSLIMWSVSALLGNFIPIDLFRSQDLGLWYFIFTIIAIVCLCFWIYYNVIFNVEKKFGQKHWTDAYKLFFLYFFTVAILMSYSFPFSIIYTNRIANIVTDNEFIKDINTVNTADPYIVSDSYKYERYNDTISDIDYVDMRKCIQFGEYTNWSLRVDTIKFPNLLSSYELERNYRLIKSDRAKIEAIEDLHQVLDKYNVDVDFDVTAKKQFETYTFWCSKSPVSFSDFSSENYNYNYQLRQCIDNITSAKFETLYMFRGDFLIFMLYMSICTALLLLLFRIVFWKQYLIAAITCFLLPILLFIITQFIPYDYRINYSSKDSIYLFLLLLSYGIALFFTLKSVFENKQFTAFDNICGQLVFVTTPFLPVALFIACKEFFDVFDYKSTTYPTYITNSSGYTEIDPAYYNTYEYRYEQAMNAYWQHQSELWLNITLYGGLLLFIIIIMPLMYHLFVKQLALPRKK